MPLSIIYLTEKNSHDLVDRAPDLNMIKQQPGIFVRDMKWNRSSRNTFTYIFIRSGIKARHALDLWLGLDRSVKFRPTYKHNLYRWFRVLIGWLLGQKGPLIYINIYIYIPVYGFNGVTYYILHLFSQALWALFTFLSNQFGYPLCIHFKIIDLWIDNG